MNICKSDGEHFEFSRNVKLHIDPAFFFFFQRIDEIMKRTRKSDVSPEVKVGIQRTILIVPILSRKEWQNVFGEIVGLREG